MSEFNPYQTPKSSQPRVGDNSTKFRHRNFRLTIDEVQESRHFVIGNLRGAMIFTFLQQTVWMTFMAGVLDGRRLLHLAATSAVLFWICFLIVVAVGRGKLTPQQTLGVKWGYLPLFLIVANVQNLVVVLSQIGL